MADIQIEATTEASLMYRAVRGGPFWTSATVGYVIYLDINADLVYRKTADGGATWGAAQVIAAAAACNALVYDCWADWQTAGDAGKKIHIVYMSLDTNEVRYVYLDTSDDSVGGDDLIETCKGTGTFYGFLHFDYNLVSITKAIGGNFAVALKYVDTDVSYFQSFYTSPDAATWTSKTNPYEARTHRCLLFPGNEADTQDVWVAYWDATTNEISLKTFDNSGNSWSEQLISANMERATTYMQMDGAIRLSDGHLLLAAWSEFDAATADLMVWDINGAGSITAKANVLTDSDDSFLVSVFINQSNDDIYVAYAKGTAPASLVKVFYQLSQDGGANWDGQTAMQADAEDNEKWISCGAAKAVWGGKFQPVWFNDDLDDIFTNTDNGISIGVSYSISTSCGLTAAVTVARAIAWDRAMSPGLTAVVTVARAIVWDRAISAGLTVTVTIVRTLAWDRAISALLAATVTIARAVTWDRATTSNLTASVTVARAVTWDRAVSAGLTVAVTVERAVAWGRTIISNIVADVRWRFFTKIKRRIAGIGTNRDVESVGENRDVVSTSENRDREVF